MLPIVLVLLVATSALAAPSVSINQVGINEIAPLRDNGGQINSAVTDRAFELIDGADSNIYTLTIQQIINDLANLNDPYAQALALSQSLAIIGELGSGIPGDACEASAVVDSYASGRSSGGAVRNYLNRLASNVDVISQLASNPNSLRYSTGPRGGCAGSGRTYQFEAAWDAILDRASPYNIGLINEEYCAAKRLYNAFNARSNNVGAHITAASVPAVVEAVRGALGPISNFLRAVGNGSHTNALASAAKGAILS